MAAPSLFIPALKALIALKELKKSSAGCLQFDNEISKDLRPRLERTGDADLLQPFLDYFSGKSFKVGTSLLALWEGDFCIPIPLDSTLGNLCVAQNVLQTYRCQVLWLCSTSRS